MQINSKENNKCWWEQTILQYWSLLFQGFSSRHLFVNVTNLTGENVFNCFSEALGDHQSSWRSNFLIFHLLNMKNCNFANSVPASDFGLKETANRLNLEILRFVMMIEKVLDMVFKCFQKVLHISFRLWVSFHNFGSALWFSFCIFLWSSDSKCQKSV